MTRQFIGIDPGQSGAIALILEIEGVPELQMFTYLFKNMTDNEMLETLNSMNAKSFCLLEHVWVFPGRSNVGSFTFGQHFGKIKMALAATGNAYELITPGKWQKEMQCRTKGDKNVTKIKAAAMFPRTKVTHANADALLLAELCRRKYGAKPQ